MISSENIFSALSRYNSAVDENYLTESFVFIINAILQAEREIGIGLLTRFCVNDHDFSFDIDESLSVSTQEVTEQGTPDIRVSTPNKLIYVEVKHDSPLGHDQLSRYKKALQSATADTKHVVLLTRFAIDIEEEEERPYKHIRWFQVYNWLEDAKVRIKDPVTIYLINSFNSFLEVKQMSLQKVGWEYINGVPALNNLVNMLEVAVQGASIPIHSKSSGWEYKGFWLEGKQFITVVYYDNHLVVTFELMDKNKYDKKLLGECSYELREGKDRLWFRLDLEKCYFFSLDKDAQLEELVKFIKTSYDKAKRMRTTGE